VPSTIAPSTTAPSPIVAPIGVPGHAARDGAAASADACFARLVARWSGDSAHAASAVIGWDVWSDDGTERHLMELSGSGCAMVASTDGHLSAMVGLSAEHLARLVDGRLELIAAFLAGEVRLSGDLGLIRELPIWFGLPAPAPVVEP